MVFFGSHGSGDKCFDWSRDLRLPVMASSTSLMLTIVEFVYMTKMVHSSESSPHYAGGMYAEFMQIHVL